MIGLPLLLAAAQGGGVPPVSVGADAFRAVPAREVSCRVGRGAGQSPFDLAGRLPDVPLEAQSQGRAYGLQARLASRTLKRLSGAFPANLTFSIGDIVQYSVVAEREGGPTMILQFEMFGGSGFVNVTAHDPKGLTSAYATGLCTAKTIGSAAQ